MSENDQKLRKIAARRVNYRISINIHVVSYIFVNVCLFIVNQITSPDFLWVVYPIFGWFIGLTIHIANYAVFMRGISDGVKISVIIHTTTYCSTVIALIFINLFAYNMISWALYPAIFWGFGLACHLVVYLYTSGAIGTGRETAITREMEKIRVRSI